MVRQLDVPVLVPSFVSHLHRVEMAAPEDAYGSTAGRWPGDQLHPETNCYRQQYLKKNPYGYCPDHGTGVSCPIRVGVIYGTGVKAEPVEG